MSRNLLNSLRKNFNVVQLKKIFRVSNDVMNAIQPFLEKPTPLSAAHAAFSVCNVMVNELEIWPDDFFNENWESPYGCEFNSIIYTALQHKEYSTIVTSDKTMEIRIVKLKDVTTGESVKIGYTFMVRSGEIDRICVPVDQLDLAKKILKQELWTAQKHDNIILRYAKTQGRDQGVVIEIDDAFQPMPSSRADEYSKYLKRCIEANVFRSVMLYGPPGTGKSTMARTLINNLGLKSFRIRVEDIGHIETSTIFEAINIFEPDAVIFDDFDRASSQMALLETLEYFHSRVKLVVATVNNRNNLDEAIMRPGRFDELVHIHQMDVDVVKSILGDDHADALPIVKDWPVAFIQEYVKRRRFMDKEEAEKSIKELAQRVKRLDSYEDDDGIENVMRVSPNPNTITDLTDLIKMHGRKRRKKI